MMTKITKKLRDDAAVLCALRASHPGFESFEHPCEAIGVSVTSQTAELARLALGAAYHLRLGRWTSGRPELLQEWWAEAEAKIREGFVPAGWVNA
jgi:hypothetical protein